MRQAVLLEASDLTALKAGTPLTLSVGGVDLMLLMARSSPRVVPPTPSPSNGTRTQYTDAQRRKILRIYDKTKFKTRYLERHHLHHSMIVNWRKILKTREKTHA